MYPFDYLAWSNNQKHEDLIRQANDYRQFNEASRIHVSSGSPLSKILSLIGKELSNVGYSLEVRYESRPES